MISPTGSSSSVLSARRILFFTEGWGTGGIETLVLGIVSSKAFQESGYEFDVYSICEWNDTLDAVLTNLGGRHFVEIPNSHADIFTKIKRGSAGFSRLLAKQSYDVVHVNATNGMDFLYASIARKSGVPSVIVHSHNSDFDDPGSHAMLKRLGHWWGRQRYGDAATGRVAVSSEAGDFLFGGRSYEVVHNGVDSRRFAFSPENRRKVREQIQADDEVLLFGNVGRVDRRKNPLFQIGVFAEIKRLAPRSLYLLVGDGALKDEAKAYAASLGVEKDVCILPATNCPEAYYSALDCVLMPSITEGFGLTALEAQCGGVPVLASEALPREVGVTPMFMQLPLAASASDWASAAVALAQEKRNRSSFSALVQQSDYDVEHMARRLLQVWDGGRSDE